MASGILNGMQGKLGRAAWRSVISIIRSEILILNQFRHYHRWLFYIEGSLTIAVAMVAIFILPDFPTTTRWLTPLERSLAIRRMAEDGGLNVGDQEETEHDPTILPDNSAMSKRRFLGKLSSNGSGFWLAVLDFKVWWLAIALTSEVTALSFNAFFPTLGATLGFNTTVTLIIIAPPWFLAAFAAFVNSRLVVDLKTDQYKPCR